MSDVLFHLGHALRLIRRHPAYSAFAVLTLATGIGAATAVFSLVQAVLLRDLPFAETDRLAWMYNARTERDRAPFSIQDLEDYRRDNTTLAGLAVFTNWAANLTGGGEAERLEGTRVSGDFFRLLGAQPALGRVLEPRDEANNERVAVITAGLWKRRFGGDPSIVGTSISLNGAPYAVVGVMPPDFVFPFRDAEVAVPVSLVGDPRRADRGANFLRVVARLKPGATFGQAKVDLDTIGHRLQGLYPDEDARKTGVNLYPLHDEIVSDYRQILWTLFAAVGLLLAIGCGNLANLSLLRATGRRTELGLRLALGASPQRIMLQLATETLVLVGIGGALAMVLARGAIAAWRALGPPNFPRLTEVRIDGPVIAFSAAICAAIVVACGLLPGWLAARDLKDAVASGLRTATSGARDTVVRRVFVVLQVGGATALLVCMGLAARGFGRLERVDAGFTPDHAVSLQLSLPPARYANREAIARVYEALRIRLATVPNVRSMGSVSLLPLSGLLSAMDLGFPDRPPPAPDQVPQAHFRIASPGYFAAAGIDLIDGRDFSEHDGPQSTSVAMVSRAFAERHWPGERVVGRHVRIDQGSPWPPLEIVGVVKNVKQFTVDAPATADLYVPLAQMPPSQAASFAARMSWVIRTESDPVLSIPEIRRAVHAVDPDVATSSVRTFDQVLSASLGSRQASVRLLEVFGQVALALAVIGVYAVAASSANARTRELAIRSALGASRAQLIRLVLAAEMRAVVIGVAAGLTVAWLAARSLGGGLLSAQASDSGTYLLVGVLLAVLSFAATYVPAARAGRSDPAALLRT